MAESSPPVGEFARRFNEFVRVMTEAADNPEPPLLRRLREHLGGEPEQLPVNSANFGVADRPNLQLALDAVLPDGETIGVFNPHRHHMGVGFSPPAAGRAGESLKFERLSLGPSEPSPQTSTGRRSLARSRGSHHWNRVEDRG